MMQKRELTGDVINTAERLAGQTQEVSCAVDPHAKDAACRCAKWYNEILASARPAIQRRHRNFQSRIQVTIHDRASRGWCAERQCHPAETYPRRVPLWWLPVRDCWTHRRGSALPLRPLPTRQRDGVLRQRANSA